MPGDDLSAIKERAAEVLMRLPGVTAVGIGGRERGGRIGGDLVIKVFVADKRPLDEVPPGERIPAEFEGVPTDVVPMDVGELLNAPAPPVTTAPPGKPEVPESDLDDRRWRPLVGGARIQATHPGAGFGTLACFLQDPVVPGLIYALTCWHVVAVHDSQGKPLELPIRNLTRLGQPTKASSSTERCSNIVGTFVRGAMDGVRDAAALVLVPGTRWQADIVDIGPVRGTHTVTAADLAQGPYRVRKSGIRSGLTGGVVSAINATYVALGKIFRNAIIVQPNPDPAQPAGTQLFFAQRGDSGSALVNGANEVVGLTFAATLEGSPLAIGNAAAVPIADVLSRFEDEDLPVRVATATQPGVIRTVPVYGRPLGECLEEVAYSRPVHAGWPSTAP